MRIDVLRFMQQLLDLRDCEIVEGDDAGSHYGLSVGVLLNARQWLTFHACAVPGDHRSDLSNYTPLPRRLDTPS